MAINAALKQEIVSNAVLNAFRDMLTPWSVFARDYGGELARDGGNKVSVPLFNSLTAASFAGDYTTSASNDVGAVEVIGGGATSGAGGSAGSNGSPPGTFSSPASGSNGSKLSVMTYPTQRVRRNILGRPVLYALSISHVFCGSNCARKSAKRSCWFWFCAAR